MDHYYEVRRWRGWYRHITLSLLALRVQEKKKTVQGLIALSVPELRRLRSQLLWRASQGIEHVLHRSTGLTQTIYFNNLKKFSICHV